MRSSNFESRPDVSIIIPVHNSEQFLVDCIESIRLHTPGDVNIEAIVVLNGSTDASLNLIKAYSKKQKWVRYWNLERSGRSFARNFGIRQASGRFLMFLDSDDLFAFGDGIRVAIEALDANSNLFAVWSDTVLRKGKQDVRVPATKFKFSDLENKNCFSISSVLIRNVKLSSFPEDMYLYEDWVFRARSLKGKHVTTLKCISSVVIHRADNTTARAVTGILTGQIKARARIRDLFPRRSIKVILRDIKKEILYVAGSSSASDDKSVLKRYYCSVKILRSFSYIPLIQKVFNNLYNKNREAHLSAYQDS